MIVQEGERKFLMAVIAVVGVALIVLLVLIFKAYTEGLGKTAVISCAGIFGGYGTANVVQKKLVPLVTKKK